MIEQPTKGGDNHGSVDGLLSSRPDLHQLPSVDVVIGMRFRVKARTTDEGVTKILNAFNPLAVDLEDWAVVSGEIKQQVESL